MRNVTKYLSHCRKLSRLSRWAVLVLLVGIMLSSCSNRGVRMPRHRKKAKCDCPTFSQWQERCVYDAVDVAQL